MHKAVHYDDTVTYTWRAEGHRTHSIQDENVPYDMP